jgi:iron complex outermembrane receptor protein
MTMPKDVMRRPTDRLFPKASLSTLAVTAAVGFFGQAIAADTSTDKSADEDKNTSQLGKVMVTSRNRAEFAQDIPLPVSVVGGSTLERDDLKSVWDIVQKAPNIQTIGDNARKVSISIRGIGRNGANDSAEGSVSTIVDGVSLYYAGQAWSDYVDLDRIEVLRGPQGTLLGKNTTLGAVNIVTKLPSFKPESSYSVEVGDRKTLQGKFSSTGSVIDGLLAFRGSFIADRANGMYHNTYQTGETWNERNRTGGRVQFLLTPSEHLTDRVIVDALRSDERVNLSFPISDGPATFADGSPRTSTYLTQFRNRHYFDNVDGTPYQPSMGTDTLIFENAEARPQQTNQRGISNELSWFLDGYTFTSITAYRYQNFDIKNGGQTRYYIGNSGQQLWNEQTSQEFRLSSDVGKTFDYQVGLYYLRARVYSDDPTYYGEDAGAWQASNSQYNLLYNGANAGGAGVNLSPGIGRELLRDSLKGIYQSSVTDAKLNSYAAFGQVNWHVTDKATLTVGLRDTREEKTNRISQQLDRAGKPLTLTNYSGATTQQLAAAQAIRTARIAAPYDWVDGNRLKPKDLIAWTVSPNYKLTDDILLYASAARGVKSGFIYFNTANTPGTAGFETDIRPEKSLDYELGIKSLLFNRTLQLNVNVYQTKVSDYQTAISYLDPLDNVTVRSRWTNADGVTARGVEYEVNYALNRQLSFNLNGSYNLAKYDNFQTTCPDLPTNAICDLSDKQIYGAPKHQINVGADYQVPLRGALVHVYFNDSYRSGTYLAASQSPFTWQSAYAIASGGIGIITPNGKYEFAVVGKNLFDKSYAITRSTYGSTAAVSWVPGEGRYVGVRFRAKV